jgi:alkylation response protein AidB-like acyl-CoA dehydrogenase
MSHNAPTPDGATQVTTELFHTDPDVKDLLGVVRTFCNDEVRPRARSIEDSAGAYDGLVQTAAQIGLQGLIFDGTGNIDPTGFATAHETTEVLASYSGSLALALSIARLHGYMLSRYADPAVRDRWLPNLIAGKSFGCFAISEPHAGTDVRAITTVARQQGDTYVLDGDKAWITQAPCADFGIVLAKLDSKHRDAQTAAFVVDLAEPGVQIGQAEPMIGFRGVPLATLSFQGHRVPATARMNVDGFSGMLEGVNLARLDCASYALGFIRGSLRECASHLSSREAFGRPLASSEVIRSELGAMLAEYLAARHVVLAAVESFATGGGGNTTLISSAKLVATEAAMRQTTAAVQLLGGAGVHEDYLVQSFWRDAKTIEIIDGTSQIHRLMLGRTATQIDWDAAVPSARR